MGGSPTQPEQYNTARMMDRMKQETYPMLKQEKVTMLDPTDKEAANYARIEKQGMSDDIDQEVIGAVKDLGKMAKKNLIDPAVSAGKKAAIDYLEFSKGVPFPIPAVKQAMVAADDKMIKYLGGTPEKMESAEMYPMLIDEKYEVLDPILGTKIKGAISPTGIQQNTSIDKIRYDRNASGSEFKGVKAKAKPAKSVINMTADEAMQDL
jgi:hypothetical protein